MPGGKFHDLSTSLELVQVIGPGLHHPPPLLQEPRPVVGLAQSIGNTVGKLVLDNLRGVVKPFMEQGAGHRPPAMRGDLVLGVQSHPVVGGA